LCGSPVACPGAGHVTTWNRLGNSVLPIQLGMQTGIEADRCPLLSRTIEGNGLRQWGQIRTMYIWRQGPPRRP
jgi:hypothetical protein